MRHQDFREKLDEWIDGELSPAEAADVAAHAESCSECRAEAQAARGLSRALFSAPAPRGREAFVSAVMAGARGEPAAGAAWARAPRWLSPALGMAFAGLLAGFLLGGVGPDDPFEGVSAGSGYALAAEER